MPDVFQIVATVVDRTTRPLRAMTRGIVRFGRQIAAVPLKAFSAGLNQIQGLLIGLGSYLTFRGIQALVIDAARATTEFDRWSQKLSINRDELSKLTASTRLLNIEDEILFEGLKTLQERIEDAATGGTTFLEQFDRLGVTVRRADGSIRGVAEIIPELAAGYQRAAEAGQTLTLATEDLIGGSENVLELWLRQGPEAIARAGELATAAGLLITDEQVDAAKDLRFVFQQLSLAAEAFGRQFLVAFGPQITEILGVFFRLLTQNREQLFGLIRLLGRIASAALVVFSRVVELVAKAFEFVLGGGLQNALREVLSLLGSFGGLLDDIFSKLGERIKNGLGISTGFFGESGLASFLTDIKGFASEFRAIVGQLDFRNLFNGDGDSPFLSRDTFAEITNGAREAESAWTRFFNSFKAAGREFLDTIATAGALGRSVFSQLSGAVQTGLTNAFVEVGSAVVEFAKGVSDLGGFFQRAKAAGIDFARTLLSELARIAAQLLVIRILSAAIGAFSGGASAAQQAQSQGFRVAGSTTVSPSFGGDVGLSGVANARAGGGGGGAVNNFNIYTADVPTFKQLVAQEGAFVGRAVVAKFSDRNLRRAFRGTSGGATA